MHMGEFTGDGDILAPHNFNYSILEIEKAFQSALDHSRSERRTERPMTLKVKPGKPIVKDKYPFKTGLSIFSTADNLQGRVHRQIPQDISTLGWNRALASVTSQGGRPYPPPQFPDHMTLFDLLAIVLVSFISVVSFQQATELAFSARHANIAKWAQGSSATWARIKSRREGYCEYGRKRYYFGDAIQKKELQKYLNLTHKRKLCSGFNNIPLRDHSV